MQRKSFFYPDPAIFLSGMRISFSRFCVSVVDAQKWEEALDWICVDQALAEPHTIATTSHIEESPAEVS
jgi:hypothetical protein